MTKSPINAGFTDASSRPPGTFTLSEFLELAGITRQRLNQLHKRGKGPKVIRRRKGTTSIVQTFVDREIALTWLCLRAMDMDRKSRGLPPLARGVVAEWCLSKNVTNASERLEDRSTTA